MPSYLEVVLSYLEQHPRELPDLHCVSVTGRRSRQELVAALVRRQPGIKLVNAYGLTETSDDTNHEVMHRPPTATSPARPRRCKTCTVYVVDEQLARCRWARPD